MDYIENIVSVAGKWQMIQVALAATIVTFQSQHDLVMLFYAPHQEYRCAKGNDTCFVENRNLTVFRFYNQSSIDEEIEDMMMVPLIPCKDWIYDKKVWKKTITEQFDLTCEKMPLIGIERFIYTAGAVSGSLFLSQLGDRFGRRLMTSITVGLWIFFSFLVACSTSYLMFVVLRFLVAATNMGANIISFVWLIETLDSKGRSFYGMIPLICWSFGYHLLTVAAYSLRHWSHIQIALTVPLLIAAITIRYTIESPLWLMTFRRFQEAYESIKKAGEMNKCNVTDDGSVLESIETTNIGRPRLCYILCDYIRIKHLRLRFLILCFNSFCDSFLYFTMTLNASTLHTNLFIFIVVAPVLQIKGLLISMYLLRRFGRRYPIVSLYCTVGAICIIIIFIPSDIPILRTGVALVGRTLVSMAGSQSIIFASELFPTVSRCVGIAGTVALSRLGGIAAPIFHEMSSENYLWILLTIEAIIAFAVGLLTLILPETKDLSLPNTLNEAQAIRQKRERRTFSKKGDENVQNVNDYERETIL